MLKLNTCILGIQSDFPGLIVDTSPPLLGSGVQENIPQPILDKLKPQNNTGLGSASVQGNLLNTRASTMPVLDVVNNWLTNKLTADEMALILRNRDKFTFTIGVGDRRKDFISRFVPATNWHGEDVTNLLLRPNPPGAPEYGFTLTFSGETGTMTVTDSHVGVHNTYGSIRYFTIREQ
ncbi:hypothetical protein VY397_000605 [Salmonella enterica]|nr:hypothetical protein [Salmonella enterica]